MPATSLPRRSFALSLALAALAPAIAPAIAQQPYPTRPVRAVLPYSAGSGPDAVARQIGEKLAKGWNQPWLVDNKPGANGWLAAGEVKRATPDGYTLLVVDNTHMALQPHLYKNLPFDPVKDFDPVAPLYLTNFFVVVGADAPWKSVADLVAAAKAQGGKLTYGTWGIGSVAHMGSAQLEAATGTQMTHVPFKELPQLYNAVATGEVAWAFGTAATVGPLYKAKKVRLLALAAPKRLAGYTDIPTVAEAGGPAGFELRTWVALYAPKGTPRPAIDNVQAGVAKALGEADVRERFLNFGFEAWPATPAELARAAESDSKRFAEIVRGAHIAVE